MIYKLQLYVFQRLSQRKTLVANKLTQWSKDLLKKLTVPQLVKEFPAVNGTREFIAAFTRARDRSLSRVRSIQSTPLSQYFKIHFNITFPPMTRSYKCSLSLGFPHKTSNAALLSPVRATCTTHLSLIEISCE